MSHYFIENYYKQQTDGGIEVKQVGGEKNIQEHLKAGWKVFEKVDMKFTIFNNKNKNVPKFVMMYAPNTSPAFTEGLIETADSDSRGTKLKNITIFEDIGEGRSIPRTVQMKDLYIPNSIYSSLFPYKNSKHRNQFVPLMDEKGEIVSYRLMMREDSKRELMNINEDVADVLSDTIAFTERKIDGYELNKKVFIQSMEAYKNASNKDDFVEISTEHNDKLWAMIPMLTRKWLERNLIDHKANPLMIPKDLQLAIFGDQDMTIANAPLIRKSMAIAKWAQTLEKWWQDLTSVNKKDILIRMPKVIVGNIMSNVVSLSMYMTMEEVVEYQVEAIEAMDKYRENKQRIYELQLRQKAGENIDIVELEGLQKENRESIVNKLVKKGEYQILVEDVDMSKMDVNNLVEALGMDIVNKLPKAFREPLKQLYLNDDTKLFQFMSKTFQYSDFVAKYAIYKKKHMLEGVDEAEVIEAMDDIFVDFSFPTNKVYRYLDKAGIFMFNKYYWRIFRGIRRSLYRKAATTIAMKTMQWSTDYDIPDILDTPETLMNRFHFSPMDQITDVLIPDGIRETMEAL
jgi:cell fate (sporulation/competence/biofilm development) regulator YmcA (YheA/YmcA/DUF963 family)